MYGYIYVYIYVYIYILYLCCGGSATPRTSGTFVRQALLCKARLVEAMRSKLRFVKQASLGKQALYTCIVYNPICNPIYKPITHTYCTTHFRFNNKNDNIWKCWQYHMFGLPGFQLTMNILSCWMLEKQKSIEHYTISTDVLKQIIVLGNVDPQMFKHTMQVWEFAFPKKHIWFKVF